MNRGQMIRWHFHNKGSDLSFEQGVFENQPGKHRESNADEVEQEYKVLAAHWEECGGKKGIDWQSSATGHEGVHHDR